MRYFWATRDSEGYTIWVKEPKFDKKNDMYMHAEFILGLADLSRNEFEIYFPSLTLAMNECKKVTIKLEVAE